MAEKKYVAVVAIKDDEQFEKLLSGISEEYDELIDKLTHINCIEGEIESERGAINVLGWLIDNAKFYLRHGEYRLGLRELIKDAESWIEESRNDIDKYSEEIEQLKEAL